MYHCRINSSFYVEILIGNENARTLPLTKKLHMIFVVHFFCVLTIFSMDVHFYGFITD